MANTHHVIPVPGGMSVEVAWENIRRGTCWPPGVIPPPTGTAVCPHGGYWAVIVTGEDGRFIETLRGGQ